MRFEIGRDHVSSTGKNAFAGRSRRRQELADHTLRHVQLWIEFLQPQHLFHGLAPLNGGKYFRAGGAGLRGKDAEPHLLDFRPGRPEIEEVLQVTPALHHLRRHRAMNSDPVTRYVLEDSVVSGGPAAQVMLRLKAINGDHEVEPRELRP